MAASAASRAIFTSRAADVSLKTNFPPLSRHLLIRRPFIRNSASKRATMCCLISGVDGGGVSDEFISTRKLSFGREFSVIANMLKRIEPLDTSMISRGVSDSAKDSMKQTISTMLGLLPSDQFSITVRVSKQPLDRLIVSSIVTGYTLWNTEYRTSLMRIFDRSPDSLKRSDFTADNRPSEVRWECEGEESEKGVFSELEGCGEVFEKRNLQNVGKLSTEALTYIQKLESELSDVNKELYARKRQNLQLERTKRSDNDLLEYLRSLESDMVAELSRPSSTEVEEIIHQLAQNTMHVFFREETASDYLVDSAATSMQNYQKSTNTIFCDTICTSRDYLARLLFWCMLLGHHLRGLENRLHLSCAVGLL